MQMKTPHQYVANAFGTASTLMPKETIDASIQAVEAAMHDFVMRLCQADYEGTPPTVLVSELLQLLNVKEDPRQLKLDFSS